VRGGRQRGATVSERRSVRGAFRATTSVPRRVALVDDVYTTGATATAASSALRAAGARRVEVVTFARALRRN
jgi:predicted amidophosphoribosyltransferase